MNRIRLAQGKSRVMEVNEEDRIADKGDDAEQESAQMCQLKLRMFMTKRYYLPLGFGQSNGITNGSLL